MFCQGFLISCMARLQVNAECSAFCPLFIPTNPSVNDHNKIYFTLIEQATF